MSRKVVVGALLLGALLLACKKKVGDACTGAEGSCTSTAGALYCKDGKYAEMPCRGAGGCKTTANVVTCDNDLANVGDACDKNDDPACSMDKKTYLKCSGGAFVLDSLCRGPKGCSWETKNAVTNFACDTSVAEVGDACDGDGYACSPDNKGQVHCEDKKFALVNTCKGPKGCKADEAKRAIECDNNIADVNDPCTEPDDTACTTDKKSMLKCKNKKFALDHKCKAGCSYAMNASEVYEFKCD
jgi:hypothetical protein